MRLCLELFGCRRIVGIEAIQRQYKKQYKFYDIRENNRQLPTRHFSNTMVPVVKREALNQAQSLGKTKKSPAKTGL